MEISLKAFSTKVFVKDQEVYFMPRTEVVEMASGKTTSCMVLLFSTTSTESHKWKDGRTEPKSMAQARLTPLKSSQMSGNLHPFVSVIFLAWLVNTFELLDCKVEIST